MAYHSAAAGLDRDPLHDWSANGSSVDVSLLRRQTDFTAETGRDGGLHRGPALGGAGKGYDAFSHGDDNGGGPLPDPMALITTDTVPGDISTTATIAVDGEHVISTIDTIGDVDVYAVTLEAGQTYNIGMFMVTGGPSGVPLADAFLELWDASGQLIVSADGGGPNTPSGLDALLTFTATSDGVHYIAARSFDQVPEDGPSGEYIGDYELFVDAIDASDPNNYVPFYDADSPLHSIDWGSQFSRTSRNPDGDNGTRTDNGVPDGGTPIVNSDYGIVGKNVITYYYAETGDVFISEDPSQGGTTDIAIVAQGMQQWEIDVFERAWDIYESVTDIVYVRVYDRADADIRIITYEGTPGVGASLLGRMSPPGENNAGQMEINTGDVRWTEEGVSQGGFYFPTVLHELGHGHGMAHPHDNGGRSSVMHGAEPSDDPVEGAIGGQYGDFGLSQQVFTIMSYNDGWNEGEGDGFAPEGHGGPRSGGITGTEVDHFGWMGTLAALDIAVLQDKYGVNEEYRTGDDVYTITDVNEAGSFYSCIWDAGGTDEIRYAGERDAVIDLRAATLRYEVGGAGRMSFALGAWTGFTIANGVTIENASSGDGDDILVGNEAVNTLASGAGDDVLNGGAGADRLIGGSGNDYYVFDDRGDRAYEEADGGLDVVRTRVTYSLQDNIENVVLSGTGNIGAIGNDLNNRMVGNEGNNVLKGRGGNDRMEGGAGDDNYLASKGDKVVEFRDGGIDTLRTSDSWTLHTQLENLTLIGRSNTYGGGNAKANVIRGNDGNNTLYGAGLGDTLKGGDGRDTFIYLAATDSTTAHSDRITDLRFNETIDLSRVDANSDVGGDQAFTIVDAFTGSGGQMTVVHDAVDAVTEVLMDIDGDGAADMRILINGDHENFQGWVL